MKGKTCLIILKDPDDVHRLCQFLHWDIVYLSVGIFIGKDSWLMSRLFMIALHDPKHAWVAQAFQ